MPIVNEIGQRKCHACGWLDTDQFYSDRNCCKKCCKARARKRELNFHEKRRASTKAWCKTPKGKLLRKATNLRKYNLTPEMYDEMYKLQGFVCKICKRTPKSYPHVDHCHVTGKVRGILCDKCNKGLGMFGDKLDVVIEAAVYLADHVSLPRNSLLESEVIGRIE